MKAALPVMSSAPTTRSSGRTSRPTRHGWRVRSTKAVREIAWTSRMTTSGANALSPDSWPMHTLNAPSIRPESSAHWSPDGRPSSLAGARVTSTTATSAVIPTTPAPPATTDHARSAPCGNGSPRASARPSASSIPTSCVPRTTPRTGARRESVPPPKSPAPQASALTRPRRMTAEPGPNGSGRGRLLRLLVAVGGGRAVEDDHLVGEGVVAVRGREVDHLEVGGDLAQELERARGARVVERHERVVEDEQGPAIAGDEPHEAQPGGEVDHVQRALRELGDRHPVVALGREHVDPEVRVVDLHAAIAAVRDPGNVADHALLEVAGRTLHRRLLGGVDLQERPGVDALPAAEGRELFLPPGEALRDPGDLLRVDRVLLHARLGVCLLVARAIERALGVRDLDLESLARPWLLRDRPEGLERRGLLLHLERGRVAA